MIRKWKLKHQLSFLVALTIVMFLVFSLLYYISFRAIIYNRAEETARQMMEQVAQNVTNMMDGIESSANGLSYDRYVQELIASKDRSKDVELYDHVCQIVTTAKASNNNIYSVSWVGNDGRKISDPIREDNEIVMELLRRYDVTGSDFNRPFFSTLFRGNLKSINYFSYIFPVWSLYETGLPKIGCGIIVLNIDELENLVKISNITEDSLFAILDQDNNVVVCNRDLQTGDVFEDIFWEDAGTGANSMVTYNGKEAIAQCKHMAQSDWKIVSIIPREGLISDVHEVISDGLLLVLFSSILLMLLGHFMIRNITEPIHTIVDFLQHTESKSLDKRIEIPQQNEIAIIASNINTTLDRVEQMTNEIVEHQARLYESRLTEREAELAALQSQINPHFLYNTLNCISAMGLAYDIPEISDISVAMSNIYRYSIKGDQMVPLQRELQCIREYMRIMDIRFGGKFETEYRFSPEVLELYTLRMTLQPIVENAVYHGMELCNRKGTLVLEGRVCGDTLVLTVTDDGRGMNGQTLEKLRSTILAYETAGLYNTETSSIGLGNINKRIKIQFGDRYGVSVESGESQGTKVTLLMPVIREPQTMERDGCT